MTRKMRQMGKAAKLPRNVKIILHPLHHFPSSSPRQKVSRGSEMSDNVNNASLKLSQPTPTDPLWILLDNLSNLSHYRILLDLLVLDQDYWDDDG